MTQNQYVAWNRRRRLVTITNSFLCNGSSIFSISFLKGLDAAFAVHRPEHAQVAYVYAQLLDRPVPMYGLGMVK